MRHPRHARLSLLVTLVLTLLAGCSPGVADGPGSGPGAASAAADPFAPYSGLTGPARTSRLLADAKAEGGEVDIYTSNTDFQELIDGFSRAYPDVKVKAFRANSETVLQRVLQESAAQRVGNDVVDTNDFELRALSREHVLAPYNGPAKVNLRPDAIFGDWQAERFNAFVVGWNTALVPSGQAPTSLASLADPKWKGKIALELGDWDWYAAMHSYLTDHQHLRNAAADRIFQGIAANAKITKGHTVQGDLLSAGQFAIAASVYSHTVDQDAAKGAPVAWRPPAQPVVLRPNGLALMAQARHPAAALLWADWVLTDGQKIIAQSKRIPAARNVPGFTDPIPAGTEVYQMPDSVFADSTKWTKAYDDLLRGVPKAG
jgi:iron(III) transport system substrate-binding protein